jgi:hypothetical protein
MTELVPRPILCMEVFCNHIGAATLGDWRPRGSICSYIIDCLGNHGDHYWRGHTIVVCLEDWGDLLISVLALLSWTTLPHSLQIIVIAIPCFCINPAPHGPSKWQSVGLCAQCYCYASQHLQVWFLRYCGQMCLSLRMFTKLPFCSALFTWPSVNVHMLRGSLW